MFHTTVIFYLHIQFLRSSFSHQDKKEKKDKKDKKDKKEDKKSKKDDRPDSKEAKGKDKKKKAAITLNTKEKLQSGNLIKSMIFGEGSKKVNAGWVNLINLDEVRRNCSLEEVGFCELLIRGTGPKTITTTSMISSTVPTDVRQLEFPRLAQYKWPSARRFQFHLKLNGKNDSVPTLLKNVGWLCVLAFGNMRGVEVGTPVWGTDLIN